MIITLFIDVPTIISGNNVLYFDPSETLWEDVSGKPFELSELLGMDNLYPFDGIAGFNWKTTDCYANTLFRFPLRTKPSHHFGECCTPESVFEASS